MPRSDSKAAQILKEARERLDDAEKAVAEAAHTLDVAKVRYGAYSEAYNALERAFAVKPRKKQEKPATVQNKAAAAPPQVQDLKPALCDACNYEQDHANHDSAYLSSHPFVTPKSARSVKKRSSRGSRSPGAGPSSAPTSETDTEDVSIAAGAGS